MAGLLAPPYGVMDSGATNDSEYHNQTYPLTRDINDDFSEMSLFDAGMPDKENLNSDPLNFMSKNLNKVGLSYMLPFITFIF